MLSLFPEKVDQKKYNAAGKGESSCSVRPVVFLLVKTIIFLGIFIYMVYPGITFADIYKYKDEKGVWHFTNIKSDVRYKLFIKEAIENPDGFINRYGSIINKASEKFSLKPSLIKAVIKAESGFDHRAVSSKGAKGLMQLMPETASDMAVSNSFDPEENIFGGTRYLSKLLERFNNDVRLALAAYNAGPEKVDEYKGIPPFEETKTFIKRVMSFYEQFEAGR